jgi:sugar phosphate isomerase/epimerase
MINKLTRRSACSLLAGVPIFARLADAASDGNMFLALNSVLVSGRVPWPQFAELAARVGYPGTDIMREPAMKAGAEATNRLLAGLHLRPAVLDFPVEFRKDEAIFRQTLDLLAPSAEFAAAIHCPRMITWIMPSSDTPKDELRRMYKRRFTESARILARYGVRLGLEFIGPLHMRRQYKYEFIWRMPEMLEFAKECGPNVGLLIDSWHWYWAGATTQDIIRAGRERIVHVHFNDAPKETAEQARDNERLMPGQGVINLTGFLHALQRIGYRDALSVEVFGKFVRQMSPEAAARVGLETSLAVFRKAGVPEG